MGTGVASQWIDEICRDACCGKTSGDGKVHHCSGIALASGLFHSKSRLSHHEENACFQASDNLV